MRIIKIFSLCISEKKKIFTFAYSNTTITLSKIFALSEASSIAIHSMVLIARSPGGMNAVRIAEITGFSKNHIAKVLQRLVKNEMLKSVRGPSGGFSLKMDPGTITLLDIYQSIEGPLDVGECPLSYDLCGFDKCLMGTVVNKLISEFKKFLVNQTLQSYM